MVAITDGSRQAYTVPVTVTKGQAPVVAGAQVIVVGDSSGQSKLHLKLSANVKVTVTADGRVFDVTGASRRAAVLVVDVDRQGVNLVHNLHIVFPSVKIVAVTNKPGNVVRAHKFGASAVVYGSPTTASSIVSGIVNALLTKKS